jgi:hypothetical protein
MAKAVEEVQAVLVERAIHGKSNKTFFAASYANMDGGKLTKA